MDDLSTSQPSFAGEFRHALDEKNRITIPSRWRRVKIDEFIILPGTGDEFLLVMSQPEFTRKIAEAEANPSITGRDRTVFLRQLHARAQHGSIDKQGRLVIPDELCQLLALKGEVTLVGGRGRFEIWNSNRRQQAHPDEKATYNHVANVIGL